VAVGEVRMGATTARDLGEIYWRYLRVVIVAGIPVGMLIGGAGARLAMFVLRLTSGDRVLGVRSDDGFTIGRFTVGDTYALLQLGAVVGVVGAMLYLLVRPWLLGPRWFRYLTVGMASGAVVGAFLLHSDGIDFRLLEPRWLAMTLFVVIPGMFGLAIGPAVDAMEHRPMPTGWRQVLLPIVLLALGPAALVGFVFVAPVLLAYVAILTTGADVSSVPVGARVLVRVVWLSIAIVGLVALINDVRAITALR